MSSTYEVRIEDEIDFIDALEQIKAILDRVIDGRYSYEIRHLKAKVKELEGIATAQIEELREMVE